MAYEFAWDPAKAAGNIQKHQVSFEEAQTVFDDPLAITFEDEEHSDTEVREFIVGISIKIVCSSSASRNAGAASV